MAKTNAKSLGLISGSLDINVVLAFAFGVIFLSVMLGFATWFPNPTPFQLRVYITALALAAAGVGAVLPGRFDFKYKTIVRGGGALGLFALVYLNQPAIEEHSVRLVPPASSPRPVIDAYLKALDAGDIQNAWDQLDPVARGFVAANVDQMNELYKNAIKPLGAVVRRDLVGTATLENPVGFPVGLYRTYTFKTKFADPKGCRIEAISVRATQDLTWRVFSNQISPMSVDC